MGNLAVRGDRLATGSSREEKRSGTISRSMVKAQHCSGGQERLEKESLLLFISLGDWEMGKVMSCFWGHP